MLHRMSWICSLLRTRHCGAGSKRNCWGTQWTVTCRSMLSVKHVTPCHTFEIGKGWGWINHSILFSSHDFPCSLCNWSKGTADPTTWCSTTTPRAAVAALWPALWGCANSSPTSRAGAIRQDLHCRNARSGVYIGVFFTKIPQIVGIVGEFCEEPIHRIELC